MSVIEFFPDMDRQKEPLPTVAHCGACGLYKHCRSPFMRPSGKGKRRVLVVAEAPGENEDERGVQLIGNAGNELVRLLIGLGINMRRDCWLTNSVICRPMDEDGKNREPTEKELGFCRPNLVKTINELQPDVIIPLGKVATDSVVTLAWKKGEVDKMERWVGWQIPSMKLNAWICPTYHPSYLLREQSIPLTFHTTRHLSNAFFLEGRPWKNPPNFSKKIDILFNVMEAAKRIRNFITRGNAVAFDYETTTLKPDGPHAEIICCSVSDGKDSIAYPWRGEAIEATSEMLKSDLPKISSNLRFEERWTRKMLGHPVRNWLWDTVVGAHWLDCRRGICGLKFQAFVLLGMEDYSSHLDDKMEGKDSNSPNRLKEVEPAELMLYCGIDAICEVKVAQIQMEGYLS